MPRGPERIHAVVINLSQRHWVFTINNPVEDAIELLARLSEHRHFRFVIFQKEIGESGTPHFQGYLELKAQMRVKAVNILLGGHAHVEGRRGTRLQARDYSCKSDTRTDGPWEAGEWRTTGQGQRVDLESAIETLTASRDLNHVARDHPREWVRFHRGLESWYSRTQPRRPIEPIKVILLYGKTGTGKTRRAFEKWPRLHRKAPDTRWFDGYENQEEVLLDDFGGKVSKMSLSYTLQLLDIYPLDVEVKGSYRPLLAKRIIVTSNIHPRLWYDYTSREEQYQALMRRFTKIWYFPALPGRPLQVDQETFTNQWAEYCDEDRLFQATQDTLSE